MHRHSTPLIQIQWPLVECGVYFDIFSPIAHPRAHPARAAFLENLQRENAMGTLRATLLALAASLTLLASTQSLRAQAPLTLLFTYDEKGIGSLKLPTGQIIPYVGTLQPDPGPGGLPLALTYSLGAAAQVIPGDLFLLEPGQ